MTTNSTTKGRLGHIGFGQGIPQNSADVAPPAPLPVLSPATGDAYTIEDLPSGSSHGYLPRPSWGSTATISAAIAIIVCSRSPLGGPGGSERALAVNMRKISVLKAGMHARAAGRKALFSLRFPQDRVRLIAPFKILLKCLMFIINEFNLIQNLNI